MKIDVKPLRAIIFETSSICNLSCRMCFINQINRKPGILSFEIFKKVLDNTSGIERVSLNNWGEPLLNKELFKMVKYAKEIGVRDVIFTTNGTLLNDSGLNEVINSGLDIIEFSIDGDEESYRSIRNCSYHDVVDSVNKLLFLREAAGSSLKVAVKMVVDKETESKIDTLNECWADKLDYVRLIPRIFAEEKKRTVFCKELTGSFNGRLVVLSDGTVVPCCADYMGILKIGSVDETLNLSELWNNDLIEELRREQASGQFRYPCEKCVEYSSDKAEKRFE